MENKPDKSTTPEKAIFKAIAQVNLVEFTNLLAQHKGDVDFFDENGMSALQHAAYKGSKEMVQMLLDRGANVNSGNHEYKYTALHFAALSGNSEVCKLLLEAGAKPTVANSVGRTASQMAAFVGNHHTVATINNYVPLSEISYYSVPREQTGPLLPPILVEPFHKFILGVNIHPVRIARHLQHAPTLLDNADKVSKVLEKLCKREMTRGSDTNEVIAFKYHYLAYVVRELNSLRIKLMSNMDKDNMKKHNIVEVFAKKLLKPGKDGVSLDLMDSFLKDCVREFPYRECTAFYQIVSALASKDPPPALSVISCTINGQRGFVDAMPCNACGEEKPAKKCSKCKTVQYCDRECQRLHWFVHKKNMQWRI